MTQLEAIFLTSALTLIGGVIVLVIGEIIKDFVIEPMREFSQLRGRIIDTLNFYANVYASPGYGSEDDLRRAQSATRQRATELLAVGSGILWYGLWERIGLVPTRANVDHAHTLLIGLSNSVFRGDGVANDKIRLEVLQLVARGRSKQKMLKGS